LVELLKHENARARSVAANALGRIGADAAEPVLQVFAGDDPKARVAAARVFAQLDDVRAAVPRLAEALKDKDATVRVVALQALQDLGPDAVAAVPALVAVAKSTDANTRPSALLALGRIGPGAKAAAPALAEAWKDASSVIRVRAAEALWQVDPGNKEVLPVLIEGLKERTTCVSAAAALGRMGVAARPAVPILAERLADKDPAA